MVGAGSRNIDVFASQFDIHIVGLWHKPSETLLSRKVAVNLTSKRGRKEKFKRRTSSGAYHGSFVKLVHDKPVVEVVEFETTILSRPASLSVVRLEARNHRCLINSL